MPSTDGTRTSVLEAKRVAVVGAGRMGASIAEWLAFSRVPVSLFSRSEEKLESFTRRIERHFAGKARRGRLSAAEAAAAVESARAVRSYGDLNDADFVIECVVEDVDLKRSVFRDLSRVTAPEAVLCSNTSSLSISEIRGDGIDSTRLVGTHFFQPVRFTRVVEVIAGESTSTHAVALVDELLRGVGKQPIPVADRPGFLVNRMLAAYLLASARLALEGKESPRRIDRVLREWGLQLGPFEVADLVGADLVVAIARRLEKAYGERFELGALLGAAASGGSWLDGLAPDEASPGRCTDDEIVRAALLPLVREALSCLGDGVASERDVELAAVECLRMPTGPIALAREWGIDAPGIEVRREQDVTVLTLAAPPNNALSAALLERFEDVLDAVEKDGTRALVIVGTGRAFSTGVDPGDLDAIRTEGEGRIASRRAQGLLNRIEASRIPVVAAINGLCLGGGLELALACHFRYCAENARLGLPEIQLGVIPGMGGTQRLSRLLGASRALEMILLGDTIKASRALQIGLVDRVVARHDVLEEALRLARRLAAREPTLNAAAIRTVLEGLRLPLDEGLELEAETFGRLAGGKGRAGKSDPDPDPVTTDKPTGSPASGTGTATED